MKGKYNMFKPDGTQDGEVTYCYFELNDFQIVMIFGVDANTMGGLKSIGEPEGQKTSHLGKLSDQPTLVMHMILEEMDLDDWNYEECSDPEIFIITCLDRMPPGAFLNGVPLH